MAQPAQRLGDANSGGGAITAIPSNSHVFCNGILLSVNGSTVAPHGSSPHDVVVTANGSSKVFCNGIPVNSTTDTDSCGDTRVGGSGNVFIGG